MTEGEWLWGQGLALRSPHKYVCPLPAYNGDATGTGTERRRSPPACCCPPGPATSMEKQVPLNIFLCIFLFSAYIFSESHVVVVVQASSHNVSHHRHGSVKLFVFGDSYADTGNWNKNAGSWKQPYGITFPGKPTGRFSDGRVLTDYIASFLGIKSPVPFSSWKSKPANRTCLRFGMNFAYGGTGVFDTMVNAPNMGTQIDFFQQLLEGDQKWYTKHDLNSSIALVSIAGNDYTKYAYSSNDNLQDLPSFSKSLIDQLSKNLKRIHDLGVRKIAVTALQPLGCLPQLTASSSYQNCTATWNSAAQFHNQKLQQAFEKMNKETGIGTFVILDLFSAFMDELKKSDAAEGRVKYYYMTSGSTSSSGPLKPCCAGVTSSAWCGNVDRGSGVKKYVVCKNPELSFFWDKVHPSQNGWRSVYSALKSSLHSLLLT